MKRLCYLAAALVAASVASQATAQNLLANPGFELPTTTNVSVGNWQRFQSGSAISADATSMPRTGTGHISLETLSANQFAGVYQDLPIPVIPGQTVTFTGWHKSLGADVTSEIKVEWPGGPGQNRVDVLSVGTDYEKFTHIVPVPMGATIARVTYAISSFGANQGAAEYNVDDFSATVTGVPEPATAGLLCVGLAGLSRIRRRK